MTPQLGDSCPVIQLGYGLLTRMSKIGTRMLKTTLLIMSILRVSP